MPKNPGSGPKSVQVAFSLTLTDLNKPQTITAPANPKPLSELLGQLGGLLGGAGGGGAGALGGLLGGASGGSSGGSGGSAAPSASQAAKVQKYAQCIKDAGGDVTKAQQCAALLTK